MVDLKSKYINNIMSFFSTRQFLFFFSLVLFAISIFLWRTQEARNLSQLYLQTETNARSYSNEAENRYTSIYNSLSKLASDGLPKELQKAEVWRRDAAFNIDTLDGVKAIAWVDKNFLLRGIVPLENNEIYLNQKATDVTWGQSDIPLWVPVYSGPELEGFIIGIINIDKFISPVETDIQNYFMLQLLNEGNLVHSSKNWKNPPAEYKVTKIITLKNTAVLVLVFAPTQQSFDDEKGNAQKTLIFSLLFSVVIVGAIYLTQNYNAKSKLSESRLRDTLENMNEGCLIIGRDWRYLFVNDTAAAQSQQPKSKEELLGRTMMETNPGIEKSELFPLLQSCMTVGTSQHLLTSYFSPDGSSRDIELNIQPAPDGILILSSDVTERNKAEKALAESDAELRALFASMRDVVLVIDSTGKCRKVAPTDLQFISEDPLELVDKNISDFFPPEQAKKYLEMVELILETKQSAQIEFDLPIAGNIFWFDAFISPMTVDSTLWVARDINERKKAEAELLHYRDHLEELIKVRTDELVIAKEKAEAANQAKSAFLATMSHEIRTPLNGVLGLTRLALQTQLTNKQHDYLDKILLSGETLLSTINDILDFSKIEAGKVSLEHNNFNLDIVIQSVSNIVALKAHEKGLELVFNVASDVPNLLVGDSLRLGQVLTNLVGNAIKFTQTGGVVLKVSLLEKGLTNAPLEFSVSDTGIGLTEEQVAGLFRPFIQADSSTSRKYGGTGLGLTISQRLVNIMGGDILVSSQLGQGSTFSFSLNFERQERSPNSFLSDLSFSNLRVLVVDEHTQTLESIQSALESFSCQVIVSSSVLEGLAQIELQEMIDLLIIDSNLPGCTFGITALREKFPELMLIVLANEPGVSPKGSEAGLQSEYLVKPVTRSQLFNAIMQGLGKNTIDRIVPEAPSKHDEQYAQLRGRQVLLVEDNEINQLVALDMLEFFGVKVTVANDGVEAVRLVNLGNFDAILMDIQMPKMDGYQATELIRADKRFAYDQFPIIAMTAHAMIGEREKTLELGFNDYISKPVSMANLANTLLGCLNAVQDHKAGADQRSAPTSGDVFMAETDTYHENNPLNSIDAQLRLGNNHELYSQILKLFYDSQGAAVIEIRNAIKSNNMDLARRLTHTLRGTAGTIGADELAACAAGMDLAIKSGEDEKFQEILSRLQQNLAVVLTAIAQRAKAG